MECAGKVCMLDNNWKEAEIFFKGALKFLLSQTKHNLVAGQVIESSTDDLLWPKKMLKYLIISLSNI